MRLVEQVKKVSVNGPPSLNGYGSFLKAPKPGALTPGKKKFIREVCAWLGSGSGYGLRLGCGRSVRRKKGVIFWERQRP